MPCNRSTHYNVEPKHVMYLNRVDDPAEGVYDTVEPKHVMYLNSSVQFPKWIGIAS